MFVLKFPCFCLTLSRMPVSKIGVATRAFVAVLFLLARSCEIALEVNRDSSPERLVKAYKKLLLKVHPDKGGKKEDTQNLQAAKEEWERARKGSPGKGGRPSASAGEGTVACQQGRKEYRVHATVVLLTYNGFADLAQWHRFVSFARGSLKKWGVKRWGATLEACETEGLHTHLVLQFNKEVDRTARSFAFEGLTPNVRKGDYLGEGLSIGQACLHHEGEVCHQVPEGADSGQELCRTTPEGMPAGHQEKGGCGQQLKLSSLF